MRITDHHRARFRTGATDTEWHGLVRFAEVCHGMPWYSTTVSRHLFLRVLCTTNKTREQGGTKRRKTKKEKKKLCAKTENDEGNTSDRPVVGQKDHAPVPRPLQPPWSFEHPPCRNKTIPIDQFTPSRSTLPRFGSLAAGS